MTPLDRDLHSRSATIKTFIYVALPAEAKPLIAHFKLKKNLAIKAFSVYASQELVLTVTGVGKMAMAAGVGCIQAVYRGISFPVLINIGVAGHRYFDIGKVLLIDKITDNDTGKNFFPPLIASNLQPSAAVTTFSTAQEGYSDDSLHDMEASGFYSIALKFTTAELAQSLKIVSDNRVSSIQNINAASVNKWIEKATPELEIMMSKLTGLAVLVNKNSSAEILAVMQERWHFTNQQSLQFEKLVERWYSLTGSQLNDMSYSKFQNAVDVITWLDKQIKILLEVKR